LGDSTAVALSEGLLGWADARPDRVQVASLAKPGCGLVRNSAMVGDEGAKLATACNRVFDDELPAMLANDVPDVAVVMVTLPDVGERTWSHEEGALRAKDPRYIERRSADYAVFAAAVRDAGVAHLVWVVPPRPSDRWLGSLVDPISDVEWAAFIATIEDEASRDPAHSRVVRLDEWMRANEPTDGSMRPDGLHLAPAAAAVVTDRFVGPLLLSTAGR
jgi:hypothetical protein